MFGGVRKMMVVIALSIFANPGCVKVTYTQGPSVNRLNNNEFVVQGSFDEVWAKMTQGLILKGWSLVASSKEGGIITTEAQNWNGRVPVFIDYNDIFILKFYKDGVYAQNGDRVFRNTDSGRDQYVCGIPDYQKQCHMASTHSIRYSFILKKKGDDQTVITVSPKVQSKVQKYYGSHPFASDAYPWCWAVVGSDYFNRQPNDGPWDKIEWKPTVACTKDGWLSWPIEWAGLTIVENG